MKKLILSVVFGACAVLSSYAQYGTPVVLSPSTGGTFPLVSGGARVKFVSFSGAAAGVVTFYDNNGTNTVGGTNWIYGPTTFGTNYLTNLPSIYVSPTTGYTNLMTNQVLWSTNVTIPLSTNALNPTLAYAVGANQAASYPVDALFTRGINVRVSTNTSVIVYYFPVQ